MIAKRARTGAPVAGFEPVLAALAAGAEEYFGDARALIEVVDRYERPFSALLRVRVRAEGVDTYAFIKTFKLRRSGPEELAQLRRFVEREYRATRRLHEAFAGKAGLHALRPLALLPEHLTIVTEQVQGRTLDQVLRQSLWGAGPRAAAVAAAERVGAWVRTYQEVTAVEGALSLDERREYLDVRLLKLTSSMLTAGDRGIALRIFDQLAARVNPPAPPLVAIHADLTPTNIMVDTDGRVTILDFAMAKSGARHHDLSHLFFHLGRLSWRRLMPDHVAEVQQALLRSFDPAVSTADPLFALMLLQHAVCHIAQLAERDVGTLRPAYRAFVRRRWQQFLHSPVLKREMAAA
jgi:aminoglycoside phosphotransferase (APT) family kinase protein